MNKKIVLTCLAAGILMCMLPAQKVNAAENQTAEDYYYQLLISGSYPYNTPANTGNAGAGVPVMPAGGWEQMVSLANQQRHRLWRGSRLWRPPARIWTDSFRRRPRR